MAPRWRLLSRHGCSRKIASLLVLFFLAACFPENIAAKSVSDCLPIGRGCPTRSLLTSAWESFTARAAISDVGIPQSHTDDLLASWEGPLLDTKPSRMPYSPARMGSSPAGALPSIFSDALRAELSRNERVHHFGVLELVSDAPMVAAELAGEYPGCTWVRLGLGQPLPPVESHRLPENVLALEGSLSSATIPLLFHAPLVFHYLLGLDVDASRVFAPLFAGQGHDARTRHRNSGAGRGAGTATSRSNAVVPSAETAVGAYWQVGAKAQDAAVADASTNKREEERRHLLQRLGQLLMSAKVSFLYAASVSGDELADLVHQAAGMVKVQAEVTVDPTGLCIVRLGSYTRFVGEHYGDDSQHSVTQEGCLAWPAYRLEAPGPNLVATHPIRVLRCSCPLVPATSSEGALPPVEAKGRIGAEQLSRPASVSSASASLPSSIVWSHTTSQPRSVAHRRVCAEGPELSLGPSSDIPLMMLYMFGLSTHDRARLTHSFKMVPASVRCEPWNLCARGPTLVWCELYAGDRTGKSGHAIARDTHQPGRTQEATWQPMEAFAGLHPHSTFERLGVGTCASLHTAPGAPACCYRLLMMLLWECPRGFGKPSETGIYMAKYSDNWRHLVDEHAFRTCKHLTDFKIAQIVANRAP